MRFFSSSFKVQVIDTISRVVTRYLVSRGNTTQNNPDKEARAVEIAQNSSKDKAKTWLNANSWRKHQNLNKIPKSITPYITIYVVHLHPTFQAIQPTTPFILYYAVVIFLLRATNARFPCRWRNAILLRRSQIANASDIFIARLVEVLRGISESNLAHRCRYCERNPLNTEIMLAMCSQCNIKMNCYSPTNYIVRLWLISSF